MNQGHLVLAGLFAFIAGPASAASSDSQAYLRSLLPPVARIEIVYPEQSLRLDEEGTVQASFWIEKAGQTSRCAIVESSGFSSLDKASCEAISRMTFVASSAAAGPFLLPLRWRFDRPSTLNSNLTPVPDASRGVNRTVNGELAPGQRVNLGLYLDVSPEGTVVGCKVRWGSGNGKLDRRACEVASKWRYSLASHSSRPATQKRLETFFFADPAAKLSEG